MLQWRMRRGVITAHAIIIVSEVEASRESRQGRKQNPELQTDLKLKFNTHAPREPVEGNSSGSLQLLPFYTALVMDLADGKPVTFDSAKSKPYVRTARCPNGHSKKLKATQSTRMEKAIAAVLQENPALAGKYTKADCRALWQAHKNQIGREVAKDSSLCKVSTGYQEATEDHYKLYAAPTLEDLAVETGSPGQYLTEEILQALASLGHRLKEATMQAIQRDGGDRARTAGTGASGAALDGSELEDGEAVAAIAPPPGAADEALADAVEDDISDDDVDDGSACSGSESRDDGSDSGSDDEGEMEGDEEDVAAPAGHQESEEGEAGSPAYSAEMPSAPGSTGTRGHPGGLATHEEAAAVAPVAGSAAAPAAGSAAPEAAAVPSARGSGPQYAAAVRGAEESIRTILEVAARAPAAATGGVAAAAARPPPPAVAMPAPVAAGGSVEPLGVCHSAGNGPTGAPAVTESGSTGGSDSSRQTAVAEKKKKKRARSAAAPSKSGQKKSRMGKENPGAVGKADCTRNARRRQQV